MTTHKSKVGLLERLQRKEKVLVAEGYVFEAERRGYLQAGSFVPEFIIERPHLLRSLYEEFVDCGSDVVLAFTYYGHRAKLRLIGKEDILEPLNRKALQLARQVANESGTLMAGNICNTTVFEPTKESEEKCMAMFKEQIEWAVEEGADYILAETFNDFREAVVALKAIKQYGNGLPAVVTLSPGGSGMTADGTEIGEAARMLEEQGADVVGLNCGLGPSTILPLMRRVLDVCKGPVACLPVPYRTTTKQPTMFQLTDPETGKRSFPDQLEMWLSCRDHIHQFTEEMVKMGVDYIGLCCGNRGIFMREMAETLGRKPPASRYSVDMSKHMSVVDIENTKNIAKHLGIID